MRRKKGFDFSEGSYYLTIVSSPQNITLHRKTKENALFAYNQYKAVGKQVEWHGMWNGKKFDDTSL